MIMQCKRSHFPLAQQKILEAIFLSQLVSKLSVMSTELQGMDNFALFGLIKLPSEDKVNLLYISYLLYPTTFIVIYYKYALTEVCEPRK